MDCDQIKFRGKRLDNGEWVYGYLCNSDIIGVFDPKTQLEDVDRVDPKTVGQYISFNDIYKKEIYTGDVMGTLPENLKDEDILGEVIFDKCVFESYYAVYGYKIKQSYDGSFDEEEVEKRKMYICGNIFDNPELRTGN